MESFHATFPFLSIHFKVVKFSQKLNMTFQDFHNIQSGLNVRAELFKYGLIWKLSNNFGFHRNKFKMQIIYGYSTRSCYTLFQNQIHLFKGYTQFFHFMLFLLSKIIFYGVQKLKGKHVFRKTEIIHVWLFVSSVAQKRNRSSAGSVCCFLEQVTFTPQKYWKYPGIGGSVST